MLRASVEQMEWWNEQKKMWKNWESNWGGGEGIEGKHYNWGPVQDVPPNK